MVEHVTDTAVPEPGQPIPEQLTIDQLAERTGISVRTIRFYAGKGLLPSPRLRGRTGLYGPEHVFRLELVTELSGLGFTLAAIEGYLLRLPMSLTPAELQLQRALLVPWVAEQLEEIDAAGLTRRAGRELSGGELETLEALGAIERRPDGSILLHGPAALTSALDSMSIGIPLDVLHRLNDVITLHTTALAEDLMKVFQDDVLQPYRDRGRPATERARLGEIYTRMKPITMQGLITAFGRAVNRAIRERFTEDAER
jgi:DNA-binding transcriptional MerR regulator